MPVLTNTERAQIRLYTGWQARWRQTDSRLEQAMNAVDQDTITGNTSTYDMIRAELDRLIQLDTDLVNMKLRFKAAKVGSIELQGATELGLLRSQGRQAAGRIASLLGVEIRHGAFSGSGPHEGQHPWRDLGAANEVKLG